MDEATFKQTFIRLHTSVLDEDSVASRCYHLVMQHQFLQKNLKLIGYTQFALFSILIVCFSLGRVARWDLLEQISEVDRYLANYAFYPDRSIVSPPPGVSVYFPGVAFLGIVLSKVFGSHFIIIILHAIASAVLLGVILFLRKIASSIFEQVDSIKFQSMAIFFALSLLSTWTQYAVEFKPDSLALLLGCVGVFFAHPQKKWASYPVLLGCALLIGGSLIFKQQHIAFIAGLIAFAFIQKDRKWKFLALFSSLFCCCVLFLVHQNKDAWHWTFTVLADDGLLPLSQVASDHKTFVTWFFVIGSVLAFLNAHLISHAYRNFSPRRVLDFFRSTPWPMLSLFVFAAGFAGAFKVGGNAGNTEFGMLLLLPFIYFLIRKIDTKIMLALSMLMIAWQAQNGYSSVRQFLFIEAFRHNIETLNIPDSARILTGSDVYGVTRTIHSKTPPENYWTSSIQRNSTVECELNFVLQHNDYDYLILENWKANTTTMRAFSKYKLIKESSIGLVYKYQ